MKRRAKLIKERAKAINPRKKKPYKVCTPDMATAGFCFLMFELHPGDFGQGILLKGIVVKFCWN